VCENNERININDINNNENIISNIINVLLIILLMCNV